MERGEHRGEKGELSASDNGAGGQALPGVVEEHEGEEEEEADGEGDGGEGLNALLEAEGDGHGGDDGDHPDDRNLVIRAVAAQVEIESKT